MNRGGWTQLQMGQLQVHYSGINDEGNSDSLSWTLQDRPKTERQVGRWLQMCLEKVSLSQNFDLHMKMIGFLLQTEHARIGMQ